MFPSSFIRRSLATVLLLLTGSMSPLLSAEQPEPIGFVELDGIGRFDIYPIPEGVARTEFRVDSGAPMSGAYWLSRGDRGGTIGIFAQRSLGDPSQGGVLVEFFIVDDRSTLEQVQSRGVHYFEPVGAHKRDQWTQLLLEDVTVQELATDGNGPMTLKFSFDGNGIRSHQTEGSSPVRMKGRLEVTGLPYRPL